MGLDDVFAESSGGASAFKAQNTFAILKLCTGERHSALKWTAETPRPVAKANGIGLGAPHRVLGGAVLCQQ